MHTGPTCKTLRGLPANRWQRKVLNSAYFVNVKIIYILVMMRISEPHLILKAWFCNLILKVQIFPYFSVLKYRFEFWVVTKSEN